MIHIQVYVLISLFIVTYSMEPLMQENMKQVYRKKTLRTPVDEEGKPLKPHQTGNSTTLRNQDVPSTPEKKKGLRAKVKKEKEKSRTNVNFVLYNRGIKFKKEDEAPSVRQHPNNNCVLVVAFGDNCLGWDYGSDKKGDESDDSDEPEKKSFPSELSPWYKEEPLYGDDYIQREGHYLRHKPNDDKEAQEVKLNEDKRETEVKSNENKEEQLVKLNEDNEASEIKSKEDKKAQEVKSKEDKKAQKVKSNEDHEAQEVKLNEDKEAPEVALKENQEAQAVKFNEYNGPQEFSYIPDFGGKQNEVQNLWNTENNAGQQKSLAEELRTDDTQIKKQKKQIGRERKERGENKEEDSIERLRIPVRVSKNLGYRKSVLQILDPDNINTDNFVLLFVK